MPAQLTYPGVYIEEIPSGVHTITGVSTSDTAFIDWFPRGPMQPPPPLKPGDPIYPAIAATRVTSFPDFQRKFGGLHPASEASYAIQQFYLNGGSVAWVIRVGAGNYAAATATLQSGPSGSGSGYTPPAATLAVTAASPGVWGNMVQVAVQYPRTGPGTGANAVFNLLVRETVPGPRGPITVGTPETFLNLSMGVGNANYAKAVVNATSQLIRLDDSGLGQIPAAQDWTFLAGGTDGDLPGDAAGAWPTTGVAAMVAALTEGNSPLEQIAPEIFNILCIPAAANFVTPDDVYVPALEFCEKKRAFLIADLPTTLNAPDISNWLDTGLHAGISHGAVYFPNLVIPDRMNGMRDRVVGPSGTIAGIYARTDTQRGVWKAPAGIEASLVGANLPVHLTDLDDGLLNPEGINALRAFPIYGNVVWGARTLLGADQEASEWKYIPIRRLALYIEESLYQGTKWVVFEPNDEPLWAQIRLNVGAFMYGLFRQGAFQGQKASDAFFVKCDAETTTQNDRDLGIVNILVGFAPLKPAEFVVFQIQQIAGAIVTG